MKKLEFGNKNLSITNLFQTGVVGMFLLTLSMGMVFVPDLKKKELDLKKNTAVGFALDWTDLRFLAFRENLSVDQAVRQLGVIPIEYVSLADSSLSREESEIREKGFHILWRGKESNNLDVVQFLPRLQSGDGVLPSHDHMFGYPGAMVDVGRRLSQLQGVAPLPEFGPEKGRGISSAHTKNIWIKTHILHAEEVLGPPRFKLWRNRIVRAVRERGVRLVVIRLSQQASLEENRAYLSAVRDDLNRQGFHPGLPTSPNWIVSSVLSKRGRLLLAFALALTAPLVLLILFRSQHRWGPFPLFGASCVVSLLTGVSLQALGAFPESLMGLSFMPGVKLLLVGPLMLGCVYLGTSEERKQLWHRSLTVKDLSLVGAVVLGFLGLYLMRSGNHPLIGVSHVERVLRDGLEGLFWVRPRFKEVLIGYPMLLLGLTLQARWRGRPDFFRDGRLALLVGLIGPISLLNTFQHFSSPVGMAVVRSLHGMWLGLILGLPFSLIGAKLIRKRWGES